MLSKIVSGGQTGVDRAALDVALERGILCGGWCPLGRRAEDGPLPERYPLTEASSPEYPQRTAMNVRDSDGTLILTRGTPDRGTALTLRLAERYRKPCLSLDLAETPDPGQVRAWVEANGVKVLNVAGPRESARPGIYEQARAFLSAVLGGAEEG
ncbi:MAG: putative molybdenum carrier protein [Gemmataceae bacterium]|nr:putative molybdenum carrier protein [Gemmataceae bacterium]